MSGQSMIDLIRSRWSVRRFKPDPVPDRLLEQAVEAALWAPRAGNRQHWRMIAVKDDGLRKGMALAVEEEICRQRSYLKSERALGQFDAYTSHFTHFKAAPVVVVLVARPYDSIYTRIVSKIPDVSMGERFEAGIASAMMAAENFMLAVHALGLGSCFLSGPLIAHESLSQMLALESKEILAGLIAVGRIDEGASVPSGEGRLRAERTEDVLSYR